MQRPPRVFARTPPPVWAVLCFCWVCTTRPASVNLFAHGCSDNSTRKLFPALTKLHWQSNSHRLLLCRRHVIAIAKRRATMKREATETALIHVVQHPVTYKEVFTLTDLLLQPIHAGHFLSWQSLTGIVTECLGCCSTGRLSTSPPRAWSRARDSCIRPRVHRTTGIERRSRVQACRQPLAPQHRGHRNHAGEYPRLVTNDSADARHPETKHDKALL